MSALLFVAAALGVAAALLCFRVSEWHQSESDYWSRVALLVRLDPKLDEIHRPDLNWAKANRPSIGERLRGWEPPPTRRQRVTSPGLGSGS
ncbi:MAG: hypothetical protein EPO65_00520 [Dehalococcoidia bacterium]|nr:MAG: hypothetical protein EPO65_00520 [Dehalococcoidia bacterium]